MILFICLYCSGCLEELSVTLKFLCGNGKCKTVSLTVLRPYILTDISSLKLCGKDSYVLKSFCLVERLVTDLCYSLTYGNTCKFCTSVESFFADSGDIISYRDTGNFCITLKSSGGYTGYLICDTVDRYLGRNGITLKLLCRSGILKCTDCAVCVTAFLYCEFSMVLG